MEIGLLLASGAGQEVIFACALIGALGVGAQWLAWRLQGPAIVLMSLAVLGAPVHYYKRGAGRRIRRNNKRGIKGIFLLTTLLPSRYSLVSIAS